MVRPGTPDIGIQVWADQPVVSRGTLLDVAGHVAERGADIDHRAGQPLPFDLLVDTLDAQGTAVARGDVVLVHTGWAEWFLGLGEEQRLEQQSSGRASGLAQSEELLDWVWDHGVSLFAADNFAVECLPPLPDSPFAASAPNDRGMMHQELLAKLGLPLGELWRLGPLARRMRELRSWHALVVVKPLNIVGATGSPANATAIL